MRERYAEDIPNWMQWLGMWRVNNDSIDFKWGYFAPRFGLTFILKRGAYFDQHYALTLCFIWGVLHIELPCQTRIEETCSAPRYGIDIHDNTFWIHLGGEMDKDSHQCNSKWITWNLPFFNWEFDYHKVWTEDGWVLPTKDQYKAPYNDKRIVEVHPYQYQRASGEIQHRIATIFKEVRQWHRKWIPWWTTKQVTIDIRFNDEVGERTGSWKGGCVGCGYNMLPNETMFETLQRMEGERIF